MAIEHRKFKELRTVILEKPISSFETQSELSKFLLNNEEVILSQLIAVADLKLLIELPREVGITADQGRMILNYDIDNRPTDDFLQRARESKLFFHTHDRNPDGVVVNTVSFQDILMSLEINEESLKIIAHSDGLLQFGPIQVHPLTGKSVNRHSRGMAINDFEKSQGISLYSSIDELPFISKKYDLEERTSLARKFMEDTGMLIDEADWSDEEGIQRIIDKMNAVVA